MEEDKPGPEPISALRSTTRATWALVAVTIALAAVTYFMMQSEVDELRKATELQWRPRLHVVQMPVDPFMLRYQLGRSEGEDTIYTYLDSVPVNSTTYLSVQRVGYRIPRSLTYINAGALPLLIRRVLCSAISKEEWFTRYRKSPERLVSVALKQVSVAEVDIVVLPQDTLLWSNETGFMRNMPLSEFERSWQSGDSTLYLYPYVFVEYEDFHGKAYNAFLMHHLLFKMTLENECVHPSDSVAMVLERYRWDLEVR